MFVSTREILTQNKVVPAFNFATAEVARAIVEVCDSLGQDVILQTSMGEAKFLSPEVAVGIAKALGQQAKILVSLHLDHAKDLKIIKAALKAGYTSLLADGSSLSFEESIRFTNEVRELASEEIVVEVSLTEFNRAAELVKKVKPDLLAPFEIEGGRDKTKIEKIKKVSQLTTTPLVLHNSSSKSDREIKEASALGVVKINWNTCLREVWSKVLRQTLSSYPNEIKPYNILEGSAKAVGLVVKEKIKMLNESQASKIPNSKSQLPNNNQIPNSNNQTG